MKYTYLLMVIACTPTPSAGFECAVIQATVARVRKSTPEIADGTFQPFSPPPVPAEAHTFQYGGNTLHVPVGPYRCTPHWDAAEKHMAVTLLEPTTKKLILVGPMDGAAPMDDVFATGGDGPAPPRPGCGHETSVRQVTQPLRSGGGRLERQRLEAHLHTRDPGAATRDSIALILKTVATPAEKLAAHKDVGFKPSHLLVSADPKRPLYEYRWQSANGKYWSISGVGPDPTFVQAGVALVATFGGEAGPKGVPLPGLCADVVDLANTPSPKKAAALRAKAVEVGDAKILESLDVYLKLK